MIPACPKCHSPIKPDEQGVFTRHIFPATQKAAALSALIFLGLYFYSQANWTIVMTGVALATYFLLPFTLPLPRFSCEKCNWQGTLPN